MEYWVGGCGGCVVHAYRPASGLTEMSRHASFGVRFGGVSDAGSVPIFLVRA